MLNRFALIIFMVLAATVSHAANPSIVRIGDFARHANGSGVILTSDGYIVTNLHVISQPDNLGVRLSNGREYWAKGVFFDKENDLAIIKINATDLTPAKFSVVRKSELLTMTGYVNLVEKNIVGNVEDITASSSTKRELIAIDAVLIKGMSGGAMLNKYGEVVGINCGFWVIKDHPTVSYGISADRVLALFRRSM